MQHVDDMASIRRALDMIDRADRLYLEAMAELPAYTWNNHHRRNRVHVLLCNWRDWLEYHIRRIESENPRQGNGDERESETTA